jgi:hypothetical protein
MRTELIQMTEILLKDWNCLYNREWTYMMVLVTYVFREAFLWERVLPNSTEKVFGHVMST